MSETADISRRSPGQLRCFFRLKPKSALLVDVNHELQHCMRRVRNTPRTVSIALQNLACSESEYYRIRALTRQETSADEWAARFIYLNRNCFNGLYRTNKQGKFNVPFGGLRNGQLPTEEILLTASKVLKKAQLLVGDFYEELAPRVGARDFVYMDPPYAKRNVNLDNQYGPDVFGANDINKLAKLADLIDKEKGYFLISYAACDEIEPLAEKWNSYEVTVQRKIAADIAHRRPAKEVLITNI
ncbi:Dam family site-specific DNA-(adenine-N6)-methyltransferase [Polaromonas sp. P1(28)-8]|nr:Dam family site-specific DNA-(adenine-N6)-methyltransferase [Polaromonas sp. P1(28)-8]